MVWRVCNRRAARTGPIPPGERANPLHAARCGLAASVGVACGDEA